VIDLHLHTTASDGKLSPPALVALASEVGLRVISVTDHDTVAALLEAREAAQTLTVRLIDGIEISAVEDDRDVHVLGYFINPDNPALRLFLETQRGRRVDRLKSMAERLRALNHPVDIDGILAVSGDGRSLGRPLLADALVASGHALDRQDAFNRLLGAGGPAFVPRFGPLLSEVTHVIHAAGGIASLAHPSLLGMDDRIPGFAASGLDALEVRHAEHTPADEARYRAMAVALGLAVSGGSDFHGDTAVESSKLGRVTLAPADFALLEAREAARHERRTTNLPA
jgi:predicted metal-dependent phosphoesterase TrpH